MDLSSVVVTIDTREKDKRRIEAVKTGFENNNAITKLHKCEYVDYVIAGLYRGNDIHIGVEYKTFDDFLLNKNKLPDRLFHALETYDTVAHFVEMSATDISYNTDNDTMTLVSPTDFIVRQIYENVGHLVKTTLAEFENSLASYAKWGIECRIIFYSPNQIPFSMFSLIRHAVKEKHCGLRLSYGKDADPIVIFKNMVTQIPSVGVGSANKLIDHGIDSMYKMMGIPVEEFEKILGKKKGKNLYMALR